MKKGFLLLFILSLFIVRVNAQQVPPVPEESIAYGYCTSDEKDFNSFTTGDGEQHVGIAIQTTAAELKKLGNRIEAIRIAFKSMDVKDIQLFITKDFAEEPILSQNATIKNTGWNYFALNNPYDIKDTDETFYIGCKLTMSGYALHYEKVGAKNTMADWVYLNEKWINLSGNNGLGEPCVNTIQVMLSGGDYSNETPQYDAEINKINSELYIKTKEDFPLGGVVRNNGIKTINSFDITYTIGEESDTQSFTAAIPNGASYEFQLPDQNIAEDGIYIIQMSIGNINDRQTDENSENNQLSINVETANKFLKRDKILIDQFTGQQCGFCPQGHAAITEAIKDIEDKVAWVAHYSYDEKGTFTITIHHTLASYFGVNSAPQCMIDRTYIPGISTKTTSPIFNPIRTISRTIIDQMLATPTFVSINLEGSDYDPETRILKVTASGEFVKELPNARLNVYISEDGFIASQASGGSKYQHNHVMRAALTPTVGAEVEIVNGKYTKTYTYQVPEKIGNADVNPYNMNIIAFIANKITSKKNECQVLNVATIPVSALPTGIHTAKNVNISTYTNGNTLYIQGEYNKAIVYNANGNVVKQINAQQEAIQLEQGLYIVKVMSNDQFITQKVVIK